MAGSSRIRAGLSEKAAGLIPGHDTSLVFYRYNIMKEADLKHVSARITALQKDTQRDIHTGIRQNLEASDEKKDQPEVIEREWCRRSESNRHGVAPGGF